MIPNTPRTRCAGLTAHAQNANKGDSRTIYDPASGQTFTPAQIAKRQGVRPDTIRARLARGWTDAEIIAGKTHKTQKTPSTAPSAKPQASPPLPPDLARPSAVSRSAKEIAFERERAYFERHRAEYGEDALPISPPEFNGLCGADGFTISEADYERRLREELWPEYRPHVHFENASAFHQALIRKIDPDFVSALEARKAKVSEYANAL